MATRIPAASRNAAVDAVVDLLDAAVDPGYIEIRTGSQPASAGDAASGTLLATLVLGDPAFGAATAGTATANAIATVQAVDDGDAGWFRAYDGDDNPVIDGACGEGEEMELNAYTFGTGNDVTVDSWTVNIPSGDAP